MTKAVKNSDKGKWVYPSYGIVFDGTGLSSFNNDFKKIVLIFGVDNS